MSKKLDKGLKDFNRKNRIKKRQLLKGEITRAEYNKWLKNQIYMAETTRSMVEALAKDAHNTNKIAASMINGYTPEVYALNTNGSVYWMEKEIGLDTSFTLYNRQTVEMLMRDNPNLIKEVKYEESKDITYNRRRYNNAITQGILQGESIPDIARRVSLVTGLLEGSAIRSARTAVTAAQSMGRMEGFEYAESLGIKVNKVWVSTLDGRTRHAHRELDAQEVPIDECFENSIGLIRFPGDPEADGANVYNCRCTIIAQMPSVDYGVLTDLSKRFNRLEEEGLTYEDWLDMHDVA